jgi:hypothetical protein
MNVTVSGNGALTRAGQTSQLTATATLLDGSTQDVTSKVTWTPAESGIATVSAAGLVNGVIALTKQ